MAAVSYQIAYLFQMIQSADKNVRFMATNVLMGELQKGNIEWDYDEERQLIRMVFERLGDQDDEVQHLAMKCLAPLVDNVSDSQLITILNGLIFNMASQDKQLRDISTIGLDTVIGEVFEVPGTMPGSIRNLMKEVLTPVMALIEKVPLKRKSLVLIYLLLDSCYDRVASY